MDSDNEQILAACNQLANLTRETITDVETGTTGDMWTLVYGRLQLEAESPEAQIEVFEREYNALNKGAVTMLMAFAHLYAEEAGISQVEAMDLVQAIAQGALEG
ncbi:hypothetical protein [Micromonospora aurantiaca (nom. illeg.)]|uniref:hypothetical protein n=1 Tax=Micromonospora aurantiaca (nom. illeg.) TaxID=47850 RepID=UPI0037B6D3A9